MHVHASWCPCSLTVALTVPPLQVTLAFVGHLGNLVLSQAVLGLSAYNVTGLSVLLGLSMGMETACTQVKLSRQQRGPCHSCSSAGQL